MAIREEEVLAKQPDVKKQIIRVYVWEVPVRVFHWINAFSILLLMVTGLYIALPFAAGSGGAEAYFAGDLMRLMRNIHFITAIVFTLNLLVRLYWVAVGNKYAKSKPYKKSFWKGAIETKKYYLFMKNKKPHYIGHNPLAQLSYWLFIGLGSIVVIFTGYYLLFEPQPQSFWGQMFSWVPFIFGGDSFGVRGFHQLAAWGFVIFTVVHVYMAFREDWLCKNGTMSSIFTGYKLETKEHIDEDKKED